MTGAGPLESNHLRLPRGTPRFFGQDSANTSTTPGHWLKLAGYPSVRVLARTNCRLSKIITLRLPPVCEKSFPMHDNDLQRLDQRTIALEVSFGTRKCVLKGVGQYAGTGEFGPSLRVEIQDPSGDFEIILKESQWTGRIDSGQRFDCDFAVQLDASCLCNQ